VSVRGHGEKRERREEIAILALISEPTVVAAAKRAGVSEATLRRWLQDPGFAARYREARREVVDRAITRLQAAAVEAVETLRRNLSSGQPGVEVTAARTLLEQVFRATELLELAERVEALEAVAGGRHAGGVA
jgi:DNA-binding MurR/RpiR family transcriptional regulator